MIDTKNSLIFNTLCISCSDSVTAFKLLRAWAYKMKSYEVNCLFCV